MTNAQTTSLVTALKAKGFRVKASHSRFYREYKDNKVQLVLTQNSDAVKLAKDTLQYATPKGGKTVVTITAPSGVEFWSESLCSPLDTFNKHVGYNTAFRRALKVMMGVLKNTDPNLYNDILLLVKANVV